MKLYYSETLSIESNDGYYLLQDHIGTFYTKAWDDYDYTIKFKLYYVKSGKIQSFGFLRVLVNGLDDTSKYFLKEGIKISEKIYDITGLLSIDNVVSLPLELDFYKKIKKMIHRDNIDELLSSICDASYYYSKYPLYKEWPGFSGAVMRDSSASIATLQKGHQIAKGNYLPKDNFEIVLDNISDTIEPVTFYFDNKRKLGRSNINLLIGKNGTGKSFLLKSLTELIAGVTDKDENWPYFNKLIVVAYSPFEDFYTKTEILDKIDEKYSKRKKKRKLKDKERRRLNINDYMYVGFRKESGVFDKEWPKFHSVESIIKIMDFDNENSWWHENRLDKLINTLSMCINFENLAVKIKGSDDFFILKSDNYKEFKEIRSDILKDEGFFFLKNKKEVKLSSGQRIYSYMLPAIVAEIESESLIILDEPELYLHPSMEIGLIDMLKFLLQDTKSYAVIATHSAIMTREVDRKGITILRQNDSDVSKVYNPTMQTYGESLETIIGEAFDDYITVKPFQDDIDLLIEKNSEEEFLLQLDSASIGDEALIYLASKKEFDHSFDIIED